MEASKIGIKGLESNGQLYYSVYKLAPYRIVVTLIGVALAFIFTMFPYPLTSRELLRRDAARQFHLLSHMYNLTQSRMGLIAAKFDANQDSPSLKRALAKTGLKCIALQNRCLQNLEHSKWEPSLRNKFPFETCASLLISMQGFISPSPSFLPTPQETANMYQSF